MCGHLEPNVSYLTKGQVDTVPRGGRDLWCKIALAKKPPGSRDGYERILVAEPGEIGKLLAPEWRGSSKNDGRRGPALIRWAANISAGTWWLGKGGRRVSGGAPGRGDDPPDQFTQTFNASFLFILISVKLTVVSILGWPKGSWHGLRLEKKRRNNLPSEIVSSPFTTRCSA